MYFVDWNQAFLSRPSRPDQKSQSILQHMVWFDILALRDFLGVVFFDMKLVASEHECTLVNKINLENTQAWSVATVHKSAILLSEKTKSADDLPRAQVHCYAFKDLCDFVIESLPV